MEIIGKGLGNGSKGLATAADLVGTGVGGFGVEEGGVKSDGVRTETPPPPPPTPCGVPHPNDP